MSKQSQVLKITSLLIGVFTMAGLLVWSLSAAESVNNTLSIKQTVVETGLVISEEPEVIGLPCGSGELMDPDTICLHGRVLLQSDDSSMPTALNNIRVDVSFADQTISAFTFLHAGESEPTYGIDITPLEPRFMEPVTVTAHISGTAIHRLVSVYPNFDSHNQAYDLIVADAAAFDGQLLWGHVVDYTVGGPVSGAIVTATFGSPQKQVTMTTAESDEHSYPVYTFLAADLPGITPGDSVTLTAGFASDSYTEIVTVEGADPIQKNLLTGWKCNDFDPFPRSGGNGHAFPRSGGNGRSGAHGGYGFAST